MSESSDSTPPIKISKSMRVNMPLAVLLSILSAAVLAATLWANRSDEVRLLRADSESHARDINALKDEARTTREVLIRIDENVKQLKEQRH